MNYSRASRWISLILWVAMAVALLRLVTKLRRPRTFRVRPK
jgi:hypothetical protein